MNHYESIFILNPALSEAQVKDVIKNYQTLLKDNGCKIVDTENWGLKKLAYSIQNKLSGFYVLIVLSNSIEEDISKIDQIKSKGADQISMSEIKNNIDF